MDGLINIAKLKEIQKMFEEKKEQERQIYSVKGAIEFLRTSIEGLLKKNYTEHEIAKMLNEQGIKITASTLKVYMREKTMSGAKKNKPRKAKHSSNQDPQPQQYDVKTLKNEPETDKEIQSKPVETTKTQIIEEQLNEMRYQKNVSFEIEPDSDDL